MKFDVEIEIESGLVRGGTFSNVADVVIVVIVVAVIINIVVVVVGVPRNTNLLSTLAPSLVTLEWNRLSNSSEIQTRKTKGKLHFIPTDVLKSRQRRNESRHNNRRERKKNEEKKNKEREKKRKKERGRERERGVKERVGGR